MQPSQAVPRFDPSAHARPCGLLTERQLWCSAGGMWGAKTFAAFKYGAKVLEMWGIEPQAFHMQSERSTTELHPLHASYVKPATCN